MTREEWARVEALFDEGRTRPAAERQAWLRAACPDAEMRRVVAGMLAAHDANPAFLEQAADAASAVDAAAQNLVGRRFGAYRVVRQLGRGGMGVVYEATRDDDEFARRVAIKVLHTWSGSALAERFRLERRLLASLDHVGIARLIDSGTLEDGALYFVMEFVDGEPIDTWCRSRRLDVGARLALVARVAEAVAYAHQHLVLHRDLKPANILVDADGQPKLLDFGIATMLSDDGAAVGDTRTGHQSFTPEFASPEQIRGDTVTTASDVYALGVLLYLLLAGRRPYSLQGLSPLDAMRTICEVEPPAPSTVADAGDATHVRGSLDAVVGKALRKAPRERYATVAALAEDLRAWQHGLPVTAAPESFGQRARRFVRRYKVPVAAATIALLALVVGGGGAVWQARVAQRERARADARFNDVRRLANAVVGPLYDEIAKVPGSTEVRRALVKEALVYLDGLEAQAANDIDLKVELAEAYQKIGDVQGNLFYQNLGDLAGSKSSYAKLMRLRRDAYAARPTDVAAQLGLAHAETRFGDSALAENRRDEAVTSYERALGILERTADQSEARVFTESRVRSNLGVALGLAGRQKEAEAQLTTNLALLESWVARAGSSEVARRSLMSTRSNLVDILHYQGRDLEALSHARLAMASARENSRDATDIATARRNIYLTANRAGAVLNSLNRIDEAIDVWNEGIDILRQMADADPRNVRLQFDMAAMLQGLAEFHRKKGRLDAALAAIGRSLDTWKAAFAANPDAKVELYNYGMAFGNLAEIQEAGGNLGAAADSFQRAIEIYADPAVTARSPADRFELYDALGNVLTRQARASGSAEVSRRARDAFVAARDGFASMAKAGTLPAVLAAKPTEIEQKLRALSAR